MHCGNRYAANDIWIVLVVWRDSAWFHDFKFLRCSLVPSQRNRRNVESALPIFETRFTYQWLDAAWYFRYGNALKFTTLSRSPSQSHHLDSTSASNQHSVWLQNLKNANIPVFDWQLKKQHFVILIGAQNEVPDSDYCLPLPVAVTTVEF